MPIEHASAHFDNFRQQGAMHHRELLHHVSTDASFTTAYLKAIAAIASSDGVLNVADFNALDDVVSLLDDSALARVVLLEYIEHPPSWKAALGDLETAAAGIAPATAAAAFEGARTLLSLQGTRSRDLARSFASALGYQLRPHALEVFPADEQSLWNKVSIGSARMLKGRKYADLADLCIRATGDQGLANAVLEFENDSRGKNALALRMRAACAHASQELSALNQRIADLGSTNDLSVAFLESANALQSK